MKPARLAVSIVATIVAIPVRAQTCGDVEKIPGFIVHELSDDGTVMVGDANQSIAATWNAVNGVRQLGTLPLPGHSRSVARGVNEDGTVVVGNSVAFGQASRAFRWTAPGSMQDLGVVPGYGNSSATAVSPDGQIVVGVLSNAGSVVFEAFLWTASVGMTSIGSFLPADLSADGSVVVGFQYGPLGTRAIRWTASTGAVDMGTLGGAQSSADGVSDDGRVIVGRADTAMNATHAFHWTAAGGMQSLGTFGGVSGVARGVSADGLTIVGWTTPASGPSRAVRWTSSGGVQDLGGDYSGESAGIATSASGTVFVGNGAVWSGGQPAAYRVEVSQHGVAYCGNAVPNSTGCVGRIRASGSSTVSTNAFILSGEYLSPDSFGYFLTSRDQGISFPVNGSQGRLCLGGFIGRFVGPGQVLNSGVAGSVSLIIDLTAMPTAFGTISAHPGETWNFQVWHRDANPTPTSNFTDALSVTFD